MIEVTYTDEAVTIVSAANDDLGETLAEEMYEFTRHHGGDPTIHITPVDGNVRTTIARKKATASKAKVSAWQ